MKKIKMKKKSLSSVVAVILMVLMVVVSIGIVWGVVIPFLKGADFEKQKVELSIVTDEGYTFWDADNHAVCVHIKRGIDEEKLFAVEAYFEFEGETVLGLFESSKGEVPEPGQKKKKCFLVDSSFINPPDSISIAPVFDDGSFGDKTGKILKLNDGTATESDIDPSKVGETAKSREELDDSTTDSCNNLCLTGETCSNGVCMIDLLSCGVLNKAGRTYFLKNSISNIATTCFTITANNVVLDMDGKSVTGTGIAGIYGVFISGADSATVKDGVVSNFENGIYVLNSEDNVINQITSNSNTCGIKCPSGSGIKLENSDSNVITGSVFNNNLHYGIYFSGSSYNVVSDITSNSNYIFGIIFESSSSNNIIKESGIASSGMSDVFVFSSLNNTLLDVDYSTETISSGGQIIRKWYADVYASLVYNPVSGATVEIIKEGVLTPYLTSTTDSNGLTPRLELIQYINTGGQKNNYGSQRIGAVKNSDAGSVLKIIDRNFVDSNRIEVPIIPIP